jgi:hypothetical protein
MVRRGAMTSGNKDELKVVDVFDLSGAEPMVIERNKERSDMSL